MAGALDMDPRNGRRAFKPKAEINVTPFVDVMLVLLIVFMITAPLLTHGMLVDRANTEAALIPAEEERLTLVVQADGSLFIQETPVTFETLLPRLRAIVAETGDRQIFLDADEAAPYGQVAQVMARIYAADFVEVALVTEPLED